MTFSEVAVNHDEGHDKQSRLFYNESLLVRDEGLGSSKKLKWGSLDLSSEESNIRLKFELKLILIVV